MASLYGGLSTLVLVLGLVASVVLSAFHLVELGKGALASFSISLLWFAHYFLFYGIVRCPQCRKCLTRFKNGKNMPTNRAYKALAERKACVHCGWQPAGASTGID